MGSEMCIRDRHQGVVGQGQNGTGKDPTRTEWNEERHQGVVGQGQNGMKKDIMDRWPKTKLNGERHHGVVGQGQNGMEETT